MQWGLESFEQPRFNVILQEHPDTIELKEKTVSSVELKVCDINKSISMLYANFTSEDN